MSNSIIVSQQVILYHLHTAKHLCTLSGKTLRWWGEKQFIWLTVAQLVQCCAPSRQKVPFIVLIISEDVSGRAEKPSIILSCEWKSIFCDGGHHWHGDFMVYFASAIKPSEMFPFLHNLLSKAASCGSSNHPGLTKKWPSMLMAHAELNPCSRTDVKAAPPSSGELCMHQAARRGTAHPDNIHHHISLHAPWKPIIPMFQHALFICLKWISGSSLVFRPPQAPT